MESITERERGLLRRAVSDRLKAQRELIGRMAGSLYPAITEREMSELESLYERITGHSLEGEPVPSSGNLPPLRPHDEIQRAHDILTSLVLGEVPPVFADETLKPRIIAALDALCWVLRHEHNPTFADNLAGIEKDIAAAGYVVKRN